MLTSRSAIGSVRAGADHAHVDHRQRAADAAVDHADAAPGEAGVDAEHAHAPPLSPTGRPNTCSFGPR